VVSALNILNIDQYYQWAATLYHDVHLHFDEIMPVTRGTALDKLPVHLLQEALSRIQGMVIPSHVNSNTRSNLVKLISAAIDRNAEDKHKMLTEITVFDRSRDQSYRDHLDPLLVSWLDASN